VNAHAGRQRSGRAGDDANDNSIGAHMLDTAFHKKHLSKLSKSSMKARTSSQMRSWSYVGRFMWGFALVEYQVNQLFCQLIGGDQTQGVGYAAGLLLTYTLELRKKLDVIGIILNSREIDESKTLNRIHTLHDLRNVIAHWPFDEELDKSGLSCDYINKAGDFNFRKPGASTKDNLITYKEFDSYDADASALYEKLEELLESVTPITEISDDLQRCIEEAIRSSDNVVRFPMKPRERTNDEPE
jgi:hypothetical protein